MYILTDGKNYVMENPMRVGDYKSSTSPNHAKQFTYKQARNLLHTNKKSLSWVRSGNFYMVNIETGEQENNIPQHSNDGIYCGNKSFEFNEDILNQIKKEVDSIIGLAAWDINQLNTYITMLNQGLSYYDSAISDIDHARLDHRPPAHIMTKIDRVRNELRERRRDIKQSIAYVDVLIRALKEQWSMGKTKSELSKAKYVPYKGRTKYYEMVEQLLSGY